MRYEDLWDQLTCENESKWGTIVRGKVKDVNEALSKWNWTSADNHYKWCKQNGVLFKFHALLWTSQWPTDLANCSPSELREQVEIWFDAVAKKYPDLAVIDVVNEALQGHAENTENGKSSLEFKKLLSQALGNSNNPYDYKWIAEAFRMARKRFPNAVLIYNDYNTFTWQKNEFVDLVSSLVKQGAPIDAYGHQSHDLDDYYKSFQITNFGNTLKEIHNNITKNGGRELQCYITEYDISQGDENTYETIMKNTFPAMWEADFVAGVTIWGFVNGRTWRSNTGLVTSTGADRSGMKWLRNYMSSDKAKNVTAKFCGKGAAGPSITVDASKSTVVLGNSVDFSVKLNSDNDGIKTVTFFDGNTKLGEGENFSWTPEKVGEYSISVVVVTNNNEEVKGSATIKVVEPNKPYGGTVAVIPGKIEAENYDEGESGMAYFDQSSGNSCDDYTNYYRKDDVDLKKIDDGVAVGSFQENEWLSYTVDVKDDGEYEVTLRLGEGGSSGSLLVSFDKSNVEQEVSVGKIGDWGVFDVVEAKKMKLVKGVQTLTIKNTGSWIDIDWIQFGNSDGVETIACEPITVTPNPASTQIEINGVTPNSVEIISLSGVVLKKSSESSLSISDLANGNYIVRIVTDNAVINKKLVVKK
ncbi:MAG: endo-1,4-beta-xylanase [Paludibacteraceae bacterium]|nr:endo-1,4-beta-xylanase [Paludibacteraceae bacterium]